MEHEKWNRVIIATLLVNVMETGAIDLHFVMVQGIEPRFFRPPVEIIGPVVYEIAQVSRVCTI